MSALEARYRRALRWYPRDWRETNGDALVGTLLDSAEAEERTEPTPAELRDLRWHGLDERGLEVVPAPVRERAGALALGVGATIAVAHLIVVEWAPWMEPRPPFLAGIGFGPFMSAAVVLDALWILAFIAGVAGSRAAVRVLLALVVAATAAILFLPMAAWSIGRPPMTVLLALAALAVVGGIAGAGGSARSASWIAIAAGATLVAFGAGWLAMGRIPPPDWISRAFFFSVEAVWYGLALLVVAVALSLTRRRWWAGAVMIALGPWWIGMEAANLATDRHGEIVWAFFFALLFVGGLALRAAGYRWRRGNGIRVGP